VIEPESVGAVALDGCLVCQAELVGIAAVDVFLAAADFGFIG
jgi:hypothetical protein